MELNRTWYIGLALVLIALIVAPLVWQLVMPNGGYGMLRGFRYGMPMMGGYGMMAPIGMWFMWLIPLGVFVLIGFAFGWAANQFTRRQN